MTRMLRSVRFVPTIRVVAAVLCLAQLHVTAAQARCVNDAELPSFQVRMLQTEMMVATLTCRTVPGKDFSQQYNSFVQRHRGGLQRHVGPFQNHFKRSFGGQAQQQIDRYVTSLANDFSRVSMGQAGYCDDKQELFERASKIGPDRLESFAAEQAAGKSMGISGCSKPKDRQPTTTARSKG